jgi:uncharacterized protein YndB with AHSA1/START domain
VAINGERVEHELHVDAPPYMVFAMFTDAERYVQWLGREASLDPRPGGTHRCVVNDRATIRGEYIVVDPPHRLEFTWGLEGDPHHPPGSSYVAVTLTPEGNGTLLRLVHTGLVQPGLGLHDSGWGRHLDQLSATIHSPRTRS